MFFLWGKKEKELFPTSSPCPPICPNQIHMSAAEVKNSQCAQRNPEFLHVFISSLLCTSHSTAVLLCCVVVVVGFFFFFFGASASEAASSKRNCLPLTAYYRCISISTSDLPQTPVKPHGTCVMQLEKTKKTSPTVTLMLLISQIRPQTPLLRIVVIILWDHVLVLQGFYVNGDEYGLKCSSVCR